MLCPVHGISCPGSSRVGVPCSGPGWGGAGQRRLPVLVLAGRGQSRGRAGHRIPCPGPGQGVWGWWCPDLVQVRGGVGIPCPDAGWGGVGVPCPSPCQEQGGPSLGWGSSLPLPKKGPETRDH